MVRQIPRRDDSLAEVSITPYKRRYRNEVRDLLFHSYRMHSHLDWYETDQWLDVQEAPMRLAWTGGRLVGFMAASVPLYQTCWLRLAGVHDDIQPQPILRALWTNLLNELRAQGVQTVSLLVMRDWIIHYAGDLGFREVDEIVTLRRANQPVPTAEPQAVTIRLAARDDLETLAGIDRAAFAPPWQLSASELGQALGMAASCTLAMAGEHIVGYQLSTLYFDGAHLARLAVLPEMQNRGVGGDLLADLFRRLAQRGVTSTTVNTQGSNVRSQRLYRRFGFERTGYDLPVWMADIQK